jgi:hypothetical protein
MLGLGIPTVVIVIMCYATTSSCRGPQEQGAGRAEPAEAGAEIPLETAVKIAEGIANSIGMDAADLTSMSDSANSRWAHHRMNFGEDYPSYDSDLRDRLKSEPYWAVYLMPKQRPGWSASGGDIFVFIRKTDGDVMGWIRGK